MSALPPKADIPGDELEGNDLYAMLSLEPKQWLVSKLWLSVPQVALDHADWLRRRQVPVALERYYPT
jgi:hypothetical protein